MRIFSRKLALTLIVAFVEVLAGGSQLALADSYTFTILMYPYSPGTRAEGINNSGQVVGSTQYMSSGFLYDNGNFSLVSFPNSTGTDAYGISNNGLIVGDYFSGQPSASGFLDNHGTYTTISFPGSISTFAYGVNDSGQVVGLYGNPYGNPAESHGFIFSAGSYQSIDVPGASGTSAIGINDSGQILVSYSLGGQTYWAIYDGGIFSPIALPSSSYSVTGFNNLDQIVGIVYGDFLGSHGSFGFVDDHGVFHIFAVPESTTQFGITTTLAHGINDLGDVTGYWSVGEEMEFGFVATPVPEPGTLGLAGAGLILIAGAFRGRRSMA